jgi:hypothetical protein
MRRSQMIAGRDSYRAGRGYVAMLALLGSSTALAVGGCGAGASSSTAAENGEQVGSISLQLQVGGVNLTKVQYTILGNGFAQIDYILDVTNSTTLEALIGGIPAGAGYTLTLSAVDANSGAVCSGGTVFDITAGNTTIAPVHLTCKLPPTTGSLELNGTVNVCPRLDALSVTPAETTVGHAVTVTASATDVDQGPSALTYHYTVSSGSITSGSDTPDATVACTVPGPLDVTVTVSDGDCTDTATQTITCTGTGDDPSTPGDDRAGYVSCSSGSGTGLICGPGTFCCAGNSGEFCATGETDCPNQMGAQACDGAEDCPAGSFCAQYKSVSCTTGGGFFYNAKCHVDADCPKGTTCDASGNCPLMSGSPL